MGERIMVTSAEPIRNALALGDGVYEIAQTTRAVTVNGVPSKDVMTACFIPAGCVELSKAVDRVAAVKPRTDLDASHPWYGYRFASACFSGDTDRVMGTDGEWHDVRSQRDLDDLVAAGTVRREVEPPKPIDEKPVEEVTRER